MLDEINAILKKEASKKVIEEIDWIKELSHEELLGKWYNYYSMTLYASCSLGDLNYKNLLENELLSRGMGREIERLTGGCKNPFLGRKRIYTSEL